MALSKVGDESELDRFDPADGLELTEWPEYGGSEGIGEAAISK